MILLADLRHFKLHGFTASLVMYLFLSFFSHSVCSKINDHSQQLHSDLKKRLINWHNYLYDTQKLDTGHAWVHDRLQFYYPFIIFVTYLFTSRVSCMCITEDIKLQNSWWCLFVINIYIANILPILFLKYEKK